MAEVIDILRFVLCLPPFEMKGNDLCLFVKEFPAFNSKPFFVRRLEVTYNHGQKSLGQSECNFNAMSFTSNVAKSSTVILQIHVPFPLPTQYNVERSKELCLDSFNTVRRVEGGGRDV